MQNQDQRFLDAQSELNEMNYPWSFNVGPGAWDQYGELTCCMLEISYKKFNAGD